VQGRGGDERYICDPFLGAVDNVVCSVCGFLGRGANVAHVAAGIGFCDGQADAFVSREDFGEDFVLEGLRGEL
jgi:hypothetical protein